MNENIGGNEMVDTPATENVNEAVSEQPVADKPAMEQPVKTYTKEQVQDLMRKRVERSHNAFFKRYGVSDLTALDDLFSQVKKFREMQDGYGAIQLQNSELMQENAFLKNNINPDKYNDIKAYFRGNGIDFNNDALVQAITTHPEWLKPQTMQTTITPLGSEAHSTTELDEKALASKLLGVKL